MQYKRFEDLPVWRKAVTLAVDVHRARRAGGFPALGDLGDQVERASLSISNHIAEGFERGTRGELLNFLYIARGSAGEVRSMLRIAQQLQEGSECGQDVRRLLAAALEVSRQLGAWIESLKDSDATSPRDRNESTRIAAGEARRREAFVRQLQQVARGELDAEILTEGRERGSAEADAGPMTDAR